MLPNVRFTPLRLQTDQVVLTICQCDVDSVVPSGDVEKCLGYSWNGDLISSKSIEENINKSRRAFFHFGSIGVFCGDITPLPSRSMLEACDTINSSLQVDKLDPHGEARVVAYDYASR